MPETQTLIPREVYAARYLWDRCEIDRVITRRQFAVMSRQCNALLRNRPTVSRFQFAINFGNMTQDDFLDEFKDLPLDSEQLAALYYALTR